MTEFERLGSRIAQALGGVSEERFEDVRLSFLEKAGKLAKWRAKRRVLWAMAVLLGCSLLAVGAWMYMVHAPNAPTTASPLTAEDLWLEGPKHGAPTRVELGNGAHIDLVAGTRARVHRSGDGRTRVTLEGGVIEVLVSDADAARWSFYAGPYLAKTTGGGFFLNYQPTVASLEAGVTSGLLRVSGGPLGTDSVALERGQRLSAGEGNIAVNRLTLPEEAGAR